jgi:hypothetical protein
MPGVTRHIFGPGNPRGGMHVKSQSQAPWAQGASLSKRIRPVKGTTAPPQHPRFQHGNWERWVVRSRGTNGGYVFIDDIPVSANNPAFLNIASVGRQLSGRWRRGAHRYLFLTNGDYTQYRKTPRQEAAECLSGILHCDH